MDLSGIGARFVRSNRTGLRTCPVSVFSASVRYRVVMIARSSSDVVLRTTKHIVIYPDSDLSLEVIALR
jgi:hypothetical protein